jgi:hypothetical protein
METHEEIQIAGYQCSNLVEICTCGQAEKVLLQLLYLLLKRLQMVVQD